MFILKVKNNQGLNKIEIFYKNDFYFDLKIIFDPLLLC